MKYFKHNSGFTLIELIVSLAVFSVVITIAIGSLLTLIATNKQLQEEQSVMTNLAFALDSMTREIRTGTHYQCHWSNANRNNTIFEDTGNKHSSLVDTDESDCPKGRIPPGDSSAWPVGGISFVESGNSISGVTDGRILYYFDESQNKIFRKVGDETPQSIVSSGIHISDAEFFLDGGGSKKYTLDEHQAFVTIYIEARATSTADKLYHIQTTITQRILDI